jgi:YfiH family protein
MIHRRTSTTGVVYYASSLLEQIGIPHAFSTRIGGVSERPFDSLNLGNPSGCAQQDDDVRIQENYLRLQAAIGCRDHSRCWVHQVHGGMVEDACGIGFRNGVKADAMVTRRGEKILAIRIADCAPVLIADREGGAVAAVHAGWRGVIAGIIPAAIAKLGNDPGSMTAAVGPCIGFDAFEVGEEVLEEFTRVFGAAAPIRVAGSGKGRVDSREACRIQLLRCGLHPSRIDMSDRCTFRDSSEFFSHRRDKGITGRMVALIAPIRPLEG